MKLPAKYILSFFGIFTLYQLFLMQTGDPIIDYLGPVIPVLRELFTFFQSFLIPAGSYLSENILGPSINFLPKEDATGFALYFIFFAVIFMISLYLNVAYKPNGFKRADKK